MIIATGLRFRSGLAKNGLNTQFVPKRKLASGTNFTIKVASKACKLSAKQPTCCQCDGDNILTAGLESLIACLVSLSPHPPFLKTLCDFLRPTSNFNVSEYGIRIKEDVPSQSTVR